MDDFAELRRLLLREEQESLRRLHARLDDRERRTREVSGVLPQAVKLSRDGGGEELTRALRPSIESSIRESVERRPRIFIEAFLPIIGPMVRRAIAESLRGLLQSLNKTLEHTVSWQGLKWRLEARRTGKSFAEVVMLRSLEYRVEQVFLIHRDTSLALLHAAAVATTDSDMFAGMLTAIQDFTRDTLRAGAEDTLGEFRMEDLHVWIVPGPHALLAAVIRGDPPRELRATLEEALEAVHLLKGRELAEFAGDAAVFESLRPELEACLRSRQRPVASGAGAVRMTRAWVALAGAAALAFILALLAWRSAARWQDFVRRLDAEPGLAVTADRQSWFGASRVGGLRDPLAADPAPLARAAGIDPAGVRFEWKDYLALDPTSVRRRFEQRFTLPAGVRLNVRDGRAELAGAAPYEWLERVRREATQVPGVSALDERELRVTHDPALVLTRFRELLAPPAGVQAAFADGVLTLTGEASDDWFAAMRENARRLPGIDAVNDQNLRVTFDPARVLRRFTEHFSLPETVSARVRPDGTLTLSGEAAHAWVARVRAGVVAEVAGIKVLDERDLVDLDQRALQQATSVIEHAFVYFLPNKDNFATEGFAALSRLPDEIRRLLTAAKRLGADVRIEVRGSADGVGAEARNVELSQRRAQAVCDFLAACGLDAKSFQPVGLGAPVPAGAGEPPPTAEASQRRVAFRVLSGTSFPTP